MEDYYQRGFAMRRLLNSLVSRAVPERPQSKVGTSLVQA